MLGPPIIRHGTVGALTRTREGVASTHSALRTGPLLRLFLLFFWTLVGAESNNCWTSAALCSDKPTGFVSLLLSTVGDEGLTLQPDLPASYTDAALLMPVADLICPTLSTVCGDGFYLQPPDRPASLPAHLMMMLWWRWIKLSRQPLWYTKGVLLGDSAPLAGGCEAVTSRSLLKHLQAFPETSSAEGYVWRWGREGGWNTRVSHLAKKKKTRKKEKKKKKKTKKKHAATCACCPAWWSGRFASSHFKRAPVWASPGLPPLGA